MLYATYFCCLPHFPHELDVSNGLVFKNAVLLSGDNLKSLVQNISGTSRIIKIVFGNNIRRPEH